MGIIRHAWQRLGVVPGLVRALSCGTAHKSDRAGEQQVQGVPRRRLESGHRVRTLGQSVHDVALQWHPLRGVPSRPRSGSFTMKKSIARMGNNRPLKSWRCAALLLIMNSTRALFSADAAAASQIINPFGLTENTLRSLEQNKQQQIQAARAWKAFHDFQFFDRYEESGIRFEHHPVDDAAKDYKAVHYDHGTGMAVADVDGDGRLDIYFVNQLGGNQLWRNLGHGKFENITATAGVGLEDKICVTASFADIDNDGLPDLFVTTVRMGNFLFKNLGHGRFKDITQESGLGVGQAKAFHSSGAVFFDFNNDGLLDLFVANVGVYTTNDKG